MLVLSRKVGQELVIGDNIRITINRIGGSRVTLGISAPDDVRIVRGELEPIVRSFEVETADPNNDTNAQAQIEPSSDANKDQQEPAKGEKIGTPMNPAGNQVGLPVDSSNTLTQLIRELQ